MERHQVQTTDVPAQQTKFIAALRIVGQVSLADAVRIYEYAREGPGVVLVAGIEKHVADHIAAVFLEAGFQLDVRPSSIATPMICRPQANKSYRWNAARFVVEVDAPE